MKTVRIEGKTEPFVAIAEAAAAIGVSRPTLTNWVVTMPRDQVYRGKGKRLFLPLSLVRKLQIDQALKDDLAHRAYKLRSRELAALREDVDDIGPRLDKIIDLHIKLVDQVSEIEGRLSLVVKLLDTPELRQALTRNAAGRSSAPSAKELERMFDLTGSTRRRGGGRPRRS